MSISFNLKVDKKIICNGQEYSSIDQLPESARQVYEKAMSNAGSINVKSSSLKIFFNGREYGSVDEMSEEEKEVYQKALTMVPLNKGEGLSAQDVVGLLRAGDGNPGFFRWLFPRKLMQWVEPAEIKNARYQKDVHSFWKLVPAVVIASFLLIYILGKVQPSINVNMLYFVVMAIIGVIFLIIYSSKVTTTTISITDKAVVSDCGDNAASWTFGEIDHCELRSAGTGDAKCSLLVLYLKRGGNKVLGVDPFVQLDALRLLLEGKGVKVNVF